MRDLVPAARRLAALVLVTALAGAAGCATENKVVRTPYYTISHPDFWQVKSVAQKPGEPTLVVIGQYGSTVINEGSGATEGAMYESSQADVEVRVFAWPEPTGAPENATPSQQVSQLLFEDPELKLNKHGLVPQQQSECGREFQRKYNLLGTEQTPLDLLVQPGWRTIVLGGKAPGLLVGVVSRVPYEQDAGLYCHNLSNMRTQLETFLAGLTPASPPAPGSPAAAATPAPAAAPPAEAPPAAPAQPTPVAPTTP
jgi:hypothetical protein